MAAPPLDPDTLAWLRSQVGEEPPDAELAEIVDREYGAGSPDPVKSAAQWVLRKRLADFVAQPATLSVAGEVSRSTGPNIAALRDQLGALDTVEAPALQPLVLTPLAARWGR